LGHALFRISISFLIILMEHVTLLLGELKTKKTYEKKIEKD